MARPEEARERSRDAIFFKPAIPLYKKRHYISVRSIKGPYLRRSEGMTGTCRLFQRLELARGARPHPTLAPPEIQPNSRRPWNTYCARHNQSLIRAFCVGIVRCLAVRTVVRRVPPLPSLPPFVLAPPHASANPVPRPSETKENFGPKHPNRLRLYLFTSPVRSTSNSQILPGLRYLRSRYSYNSYNIRSSTRLSFRCLFVRQHCFINTTTTTTGLSGQRQALRSASPPSPPVFARADRREHKRLSRGLFCPLSSLSIVDLGVVYSSRPCSASLLSRRQPLVARYRDALATKGIIQKRKKLLHPTSRIAATPNLVTPPPPAERRRPVLRKPVALPSTISPSSDQLCNLTSRVTLPFLTSLAHSPSHPLFPTPPGLFRATVTTEKRGDLTGQKYFVRKYRRFLPLLVSCHSSIFCTFFLPASRSSFPVVLTLSALSPSAAVARVA
ncbi:hypothetical protein L249_2509, partial [Ophiocordyceps polyrhachis-furcata BCC 54312]